MTWKIINHDQRALEHYGDLGLSLWGAKYSIDYLRQGEVHALFEGDEMVSGFALIDKGPLRTLSFLTDAMKSNIPLLCKEKEESFCEVAGFWFRPTHSQWLHGRSLISWSRLWERMRELTTPYMIYGYNFQRFGLRRLYQSFDPVVLFRGNKALGNSPSANTQSIVSIEAVSISSLGEKMPKFLLKLSRMMGLSDSSHDAPIETPDLTNSEGSLRRAR